MNSSIPKRPSTPSYTTILPPAHSLKGPSAAELLALATQKLHALGLQALGTRLSISWNPRMRSTAGLAYPQSMRIVLNPKLLGFGGDEVIRTLLHELAHLVAHHRCGRRRIAPHGPEWRLACADLGLLNEARCHDLPLPRRTLPKQFLYECPHCRVRLERVRPFRRAAACLPCCRSFNKGRYDARFKLTKVQQLEAAGTHVSAAQELPGIALPRRNSA